uniref:RRM domain-containing protein n=1 Tax=Panagrolaimus superbus TaxID=310955 RepID=A0A914YSL4_9BILA
MVEKADNESKAALRRIKKKYYKMIIRRLPYEMTEEDLLQLLSPLPSHERFWFRKGEEYLEDDAFPYAFIIFDDFDEAAKFQKAYNGQLFTDSEGNESTVIVEKAANQDFSKEPLKPKPGVTPITEDIGFIQFLEEAESKSITKKVDFDVLVNEITERERRHAEGICQDTPLTDYFIKKAHEKIVKNRPKPKKLEPKGAKLEKGESRIIKANAKDKKENHGRGREPKYRGEPLPKEKDDARLNETAEKKKRERLPRRTFENRKAQKEAASNSENAGPSKEFIRKQNSSSPKTEAKEVQKAVSNNATAKEDEVPKERKLVGPSQRNKDRPERAIYQPGRGRRGKPTTTAPSSKAPNENVEEAK